MKWAIFVDGMPFDIDTPETASLGGSETAGLQLSKALAERGHEVNLFCKCKTEGIKDRIRFHTINRYGQWATQVPHDVTISQRVPQPFTIPLASPIHFFWMHDLALRRHGDAVRGVMWNVDAMFVLSKFMKDQYEKVYALPESVMHVTRNGIDLCLIDEVEEQTRDFNTVIFTARPERGMDILLEETFPRLLKANPDMRLVMSGYESYVDHLRPLYNKIEFLIRKYAGRVKHVGALNKKDLYKLYKTAGLYIYPTNFEEISCITAMELMACGTPMVASAGGALPETLPPSCGKLIPLDEQKGGALEPRYQDDFVEATLYLLRNRKAWEQMSEAGKRHAKRLGWDGVAEEWERLALSLRDEQGGT